MASNTTEILSFSTRVWISSCQPSLDVTTTYSAPRDLNRAAPSSFLTMLTMVTPSLLAILTIIWPSWLLPTVCIKAGDPFLFATSHMPTAVRGLTKNEDPHSTGRDWSSKHTLGGCADMHTYSCQTPPSLLSTP